MYDYRLIYERLRAIREEEDVFGLVGLLRSGLVRNLGNITTPKLFNRAYAGTKLLIEDYITQVALAIEYVTGLPTDPGFPGHHASWTAQAKLDLLHDTRQAFGRSTLVLHGGALFGLSHLGVVKALHLRGLLPRIITGTATGALIAALVCIHTEEELLDFLNGDGIDLTAFARQPGDDVSEIAQTLLPKESHAGFAALSRRVRRYFREGYFLDVNVLGACVRANVGDLTFEEAYARTKRVLNITIAPSASSGSVPTLLNYLTAPNVLIWSAALASNTSSTALYAPVTLLCKNPAAGDRIEPWSMADGVDLQPAHLGRRGRHPDDPAVMSDRGTPLHRIAELFNVNHFVVSQARPYVAPFLRSELHHPNARGMASIGVVGSLLASVVRLVALEVHHRLAQLDALGAVPAPVRRFLLDETIPGAAITLVPDITAADLSKVLALPTRESLEYWTLRGERAVWPAVGALRIRMAVEVELERGYQVVRRRKPLDGETSSIRSHKLDGESGSVRKVGSKGSERRRQRANSAGYGNG